MAGNRDQDCEYFLRAEPVYAWKYEGQPRKEWPKWLRTHFGGSILSYSLHKHVGRYATATKYDGRKEFWRWFDADLFEQQFVVAHRALSEQEKGE